MGRKISQVLWINVAMGFGTYLGFKFADFIFWDEDIKYKIWEDVETKYWKEHPTPTNLEPLVQFDSINNPGTKFKSYLPPLGMYINEDIFEKYNI